MRNAMGVSLMSSKWPFMGTAQLSSFSKKSKNGKVCFGRETSAGKEHIPGAEKSPTLGTFIAVGIAIKAYIIVYPQETSSASMEHLKTVKQNTSRTRLFWLMEANSKGR